MKICAFCGASAEGNFSIHLRPFSGPEVWLCDRDGKYPTPSCEDIWDALARKLLPTLAFVKTAVEATQ